MNFNLKTIVLAGFALVAAINVTAAYAGPADYVFVPHVTQGEREIDFKAGGVRKDGDPNETDSSLGFGYGVTDVWFTEFYGKYKNISGAGTAFDAFEWENKFQLTQQGQYPVDVGFIVEIERARDRSEGYEATFGPLFQTEFGKTQLNLNVLLQRNYRAAESNPLKLMYQWQAKYRWIPELELGAQGFGEMGAVNHIAPHSEQSHLLGPAIFGKFALGGRHGIRYNAAFLVDASDRKHSKTLRTQVEYEF
jgi:hypothetical protein